jgi:hypothetical protein
MARNVIIDHLGNIHIQHNKYEDQYEESMEYLNDKYHNSQTTKLKNIPVDSDEKDIISIHGNNGRHNQQNSGQHRNTPPGKLVI